MAMKDVKRSDARSSGGGSDRGSALQTLLSRSDLDSKDAKEFETALKDKREYAERAAEALGVAWPSLPRELQMVAVRWKWQERKPESRAKACMMLGAAIASSDAVSASSLLGEAMKVLATKGAAGGRLTDSPSSVSGSSDLRGALRSGLVERWLRPIDSAALFRIRYGHLPREGRTSFDGLLTEALSTLPPEFRHATGDWLDRQMTDEPNAEGRHAVSVLASRLRSGHAAGPAGSENQSSSSATTETPKESTETPKESTAPTSVVSSPKAAVENPRSVIPVAPESVARPTPRTLIADAVRTIQTELRRWSAEESEHLGVQRRRMVELEEALQRRTAERDDLAASLKSAQERAENADRGLAQANEQRDRAVASSDRLERELHASTQRVTELGRRCAEIEASNARLDQELKQAREDKRKDVEYTRESERAATSKQIAQAAKVHLENMHELLAAAPSEQQRTAFAACYEELFKVLTPSNARSNG